MTLITAEPGFAQQEIIGGLQQTVVKDRDDLVSAQATPPSREILGAGWRFRDVVSEVMRFLRKFPSVSKIVGTESVGNSSAIWLRHQMFSDFLRHSIEDNSVDISGVEFRQALDALEKLRRAPASAFELSSKPARALEAFIHSVQMPRPSPEYRELIIQPRGLRIKGRVPGVGQSALPVSSTLARFVPVLDENLANASLAGPLVAEYCRRIELLRLKHRITALCFIQKDIGPVGALAMLSTLVAATGLPACVYRLTHWSEQATITGYKPTERDNLLVIYDFVVTGSGITQPAKELQRINRARAHVVKAAVVLFGYGDKRTELAFTDDESTERLIGLDTIGWYSDHVDQIEQFSRKDNLDSSSSVTGEAMRASPVKGALVPSLVSGEENMTSSGEMDNVGPYVKEQQARESERAKFLTSTAGQHGRAFAICGRDTQNARRCSCSFGTPPSTLRQCMGEVQEVGSEIACGVLTSGCAF